MVLSFVTAIAGPSCTLVVFTGTASPLQDPGPDLVQILITVIG